MLTVAAASRDGLPEATLSQEAPNPAVASNARSGRILIADDQVVSGITTSHQSTHPTSCRTPLCYETDSVDESSISGKAFSISSSRISGPSTYHQSGVSLMGFWYSNTAVS